MGKYEDSEIRKIISDIVDYLQPSLSPYQSVIYWFLFRHSIIGNGDCFARVSIRKIACGIGSKFAKGESSRIPSDKSIGDNIRALEKISAIEKAGDTNRDGTIYRIYLPNEIPLCLEMMSKQNDEACNKVDTNKDLDFYNVKTNRLKIFERDNYTCYKCNKKLTQMSATLDHIITVADKGDNSYENLITCCLHCNSKRRASHIADFLDS